jgi:predicted amidohydrolase YtcJ
VFEAPPPRPRRERRERTRLALASAALLWQACATGSAPVEADHVFLDGFVYTADARRRVAEAVATRGDSILFVGSSEEARRHIGEATRVHDLGGRMLLPGLHDVHIHPEGIVQPDVCDLQSQIMSLEEMVPFLRDCLERYAIAPGDWLLVPQWAFSQGNQPSARHPTLRAALDAVSTEHPILLLGNDGHHGAVNSAAMARALDGEGNTVGLSSQTLATTFDGYRELVAVDAAGEPSGGVTEAAMSIFGAPDFWNLVPIANIIGDVARVLASRGITSIVDATATIENLESYRLLEERGEMTFRVRAAQFEGYYTPKAERGGVEEIPALVAQWSARRDEFANTRYIRADSVKVFADGVLEGDPLGDPPTLPNAAVLRSYRQPRFARDPESGGVELVGYVDTAGDVCRAVRADPSAYAALGAIADFVEANGHHPMQCVESRGVLEHDEAYLDAYIDALHAAGFSVHVHAIGDRAVRVAVDALAEARSRHGDNGQPHGIAHAQLVHAEDRRKIGELGLFVAFTHAWSQADRAYLMTVAPFIDELEPGASDLYGADTYYMQNVYPARSIQRLGGLVVAGSDAPVETRDPRPFYNIEKAITRASDLEGDDAVLNAAERLDVHAILAAYTINGARAMSQADSTGSLEVGKKADLIVVDRNVVALAEGGRAEEIGDTRVLLTLFGGRVVYEAAP